MEPRVFLYSPKGTSHLLSVVNLSAHEGLAVFSSAESASVLRFGATNFQRHGWATEEHIPSLSTVEALRAFLATGQLGLVDFEATVGSDSSISCQNDSTCRLKFGSRSQMISAVQALAPPVGSSALLSALLSHPETYIECSNDGQVRQIKSLGKLSAPHP